MGLIKFSAIVSAASGKIGGNVFARNASGAYARTWVKPINPNTAKQQAVRTSFAILIASWKNLSPAQQQLWTDMAPQYPYVNRLGETSTYTGQQLYNHLNMNLLTIGVIALSTPLVPQTFSAIATSSMTLTLTTGVLTTGNVVLSALGTGDEAIIIEITTSMSGGITKPAKGAFKQVLVENDASSDTTYDIVTEYIALYGSPELGAKVFCRAALINQLTGQRLNIGQEVAIVT